MDVLPTSSPGKVVKLLYSSYIVKQLYNLVRRPAVPLIKKADAPTFTTPNAVMVAHAGPSLGSASLSMWQVQMEPAAAGPVHLIDRDQVYLVTAGSLTILADGAESRALAGDAVIILAGATRQILNQGAIAAVAIVCMTAGGRATLPDGADRGPLPWAA
jgi:quercetin dioxygenase-like cupin family protein